MNVAELRKQYLEFFAERSHKVLPSAPLIPNDPTLLFTAAGMVQFKDYFWGTSTPGFSRATTCQKCFRTTDIENVGKTAYHHTFFEMLGNFSFGAYFKQGAIELAWAFLTEELGISAERLSASVYEEDDDAYAIWRDVIGLPEERIVRLGKEHNWWGPVGNSGPCGPDSEIHYDSHPGEPCGPECAGVACDCDRYSEIWNLVFMQFDAQEDGRFVPLAKKNIDTGMGLERTSAVLQGVPTNFDTDAFVPILEAIAARAPRPLTDADLPFRNTIADHIRGILFLLAEGLMPGNEKQGYVLRRILRRAIRAGEKIELPPDALGGFVDAVIDSLGPVYPEVRTARELAKRVISHEEQTFRRTLRDGERRLGRLLTDLQSSGNLVLPGESAFELTDTYGFPLEMITEIASEAGVLVDIEGFSQALEMQRQRSRASLGGIPTGKDEEELASAGRGPTVFAGYGATQGEDEIENVLSGSKGNGLRLVFPRSVFYAESGGQVGDTGTVRNLSRAGIGTVLDVKKDSRGVFLHDVRVDSGAFEVGDRCSLEVDASRRKRIARNHTATHLLHAALRQVIGNHVAQAGSVVNDRELRFDFSHFEKLSPKELGRIEEIANAAILGNHAVITTEMPLAQAKESGAIGLFEDEYRGRAVVRVVAVGEVSRELCGGTHVASSGEIGLVKIVSEESIASGVRRIRAITGDAVLHRMQAADEQTAALREALGDDLMEGAERLKTEVRALREMLEARQAEEAAQGADQLLAGAEKVGEVTVVCGRLDLETDQLKTAADLLEEKVRPAVVILGGSIGGRGVVVCKASKGVAGVHAGNLVRTMSQALGGGGGGGPAFAQGGGPNGDGLEAALAEGKEEAMDALA